MKNIFSSFQNAQTFPEKIVDNIDPRTETSYFGNLMKVGFKNNKILSLEKPKI